MSSYKPYLLRAIRLVGVIPTLILIACQHSRSERHTDSAVSPLPAASLSQPATAISEHAAKPRMATDEWSRCQAASAVCSGTRLPAGVETLNVAAYPARSHAPAATPALSASAPLAGFRAAPRTAVALAPRHTTHALAALSTVTTDDTHYWYAWATLLGLLLLMGWWMHKRMKSRAVNNAVASPARDVSRPERQATPSVPLQRLTFAAVGAIGDVADKALELPKLERLPTQAPTLQSRHDHQAQHDRDEQQNLALALAEAKRLLAAARAADALHVLEPILAQPQPPDEAWVVAGWAWWRLAQESEPTLALEQAGAAAHAFTQAWLRQTARADLLTRIARSHLLQARHAAGDVMRKASLDLAIDYYAKRSALRADEPADLLEVAQALLQRAQASDRSDALDRASWMGRAEQHLAKIPDLHPLWQDPSNNALHIDVKLGMAETATGAMAARRFRDVTEQLRQILANAEAVNVDAWLAKLIDATRALIQHQSGGSRLLTLQALQADAAPYLQSTQAVVPLLAWINLLDEWARLLPTRAAQAKLAEADRLFERAGQMASQGPSGIQFARAYYLRTRSQHESGASSLRTLQRAHEILAGIPPHALPAAILSQEHAEIELALAHHCDPVAAPGHYRLAVSHARQAAADKLRAVMAWRCAARALLGLSRHVALDEQQRDQVLQLANQLEGAAADQPDAWLTAAEIRLWFGDAAGCSRNCDAAWKAGATRAEVIALWQKADADWARSLENAEQDAGWRHLHQRLRLASATY